MYILIRKKFNKLLFTTLIPQFIIISQCTNAKYVMVICDLPWNILLHSLMAYSKVTIWFILWSRIYSIQFITVLLYYNHDTLLQCIGYSVCIISSHCGLAFNLVDFSTETLSFSRTTTVIEVLLITSPLPNILLCYPPCK